ncbi:hypothetical protein ABFX02_06G094400 [Erythranthe guttata]
MKTAALILILILILILLTTIPVRMTKYYCDFVTEYGSGNYGVFTPKLRIRCDTFCPWSITDTGPCLDQTAYGHELWCQGWKTALT